MKHLITEQNNGIARIKFNRPDSLNAFNGAMMQELRDLLISLQNDETVKVVIRLTRQEEAISIPKFNMHYNWLHCSSSFIHI